MTYLRSLSPTLVLLATTLNACSSDTCRHGGKSYAAGESFPSSDGCNSCTCDSSGGIACTERACPPDAGADADKDAAVDAGSDAATDRAPDVHADVQAEAGADADAPGSTDVSAEADVASPADADPDATGQVNPLCRVTDTYTFGLVGGLVASSDESVLSPPSQYQHTRMYFRSDAGTRMCAPVPDCTIMNSLGLVDVVAGLKNADVQAALSQPTPPLYGRDSRPVDGQVYSITRSDGHGMLVGSACVGGELDCRPIPGGIAFWVQAWQMFDRRMLSRPECAGL